MTRAGRSRAVRYSRWDGSQEGLVVTADDVLGSVSDDLLYHGDLDAALRRILREGFMTASGERIRGLNDLTERLRSRREELLASSDLSGLHEEARRRLAEILENRARGARPRGG